MLTRANVGECTLALEPNPRANPRTSRVLPAPNSPERPMTRPGSATRPQASPNASVSLGLCEMNVAMGGKRAHALLVAQGDPFVTGDLSDTRKRQVWEPRAPGIKQRYRVLAGYRE